MKKTPVIYASICYLEFNVYFNFHLPIHLASQRKFRRKTVNYMTPRLLKACLYMRALFNGCIEVHSLYRCVYNCLHIMTMDESQLICRKPRNVFTRRVKILNITSFYNAVRILVVIVTAFRGIRSD